MEESQTLARFDDLVNSGIVVYDHSQKIVHIVDGGLNFQFVVTSALLKKPTILTSGDKRPKESIRDGPLRAGSDIVTDGFEIGEVGSTHFVIANKFSFARPHLLLLTKDGYRRQYEALDLADLTAAWNLLAGFSTDHVVFYNCGRDGGCSRMHKHMQLMPTPKGTFASFLETDGTDPTNVPFQWFYHRFATAPTANEVLELYNLLLDQANQACQGRSERADSAPPGAACPHNMILTKRWIMVLPRRRGAVNGDTGAHGMGMLGFIAVPTRDEVDHWVRLGPARTLTELGLPK